MKGNLKTLALIFSVILNAAFIGATAYYRLSPPSVASRPPSGSEPFIYQELDLSREQVDRIEPMRDEFLERLSEIGGAIRERQIRLVDLLSSTEVGRGKVEALQGQIRDLQRTLQDTVVSHVLEESAVFTPEQRSRFFQLMKERIEQSGEPRPPWLRPSPGGRPAQGR